MVSDVQLHPVDAAGSKTISAQLTRACRVGDCRIQRATLRMPDGEVMEGELTLLGGGAQAEAMVFGNAGKGTSGWWATMVLHGQRGQAMQCRLTLSRSTDHGFGHCRTMPGGADREAMYDIEF